MNRKKKSLAIYFAGAFAAIIILMMIANRRSGQTYEVRFPQNNGVAYLCTHGDSLAAVCHDDKIYVWDWRESSGKPRIVDVRSDQAVLLESGRVASVKRSDADAVVVSNLDSAKVERKIPIAAEGRRVYLGANRSGRTVVIALARTDGAATGAGQEVMLVDCNAGLVHSLTTPGEAAGDRITSVAVSDDGGFAVLTGEKAGQGWVALVNVGQKRAAWVKELPDLQKVRNAAFSTDGKIIYIRGTDSSVQILDTEAGKVIKRLLPTRENNSTAGDQHIQTLTTSNNGRFMAASISNMVYVWDCSTEKVIFGTSPGHKLIGGLAFSPDSQFLATADSRQGGTIKIWRMPK